MSIFDRFRRKKEEPKLNGGKIFNASHTVGVPSPFDMKNIALGFQKTVVMGIGCGGCRKEWKDALVPNEETRVVCPHCGGTNKVTLNVEVFCIDK